MNTFLSNYTKNKHLKLEKIIVKNVFQSRKFVETRILNCSKILKYLCANFSLEAEYQSCYKNGKLSVKLSIA